MILIFMEESLGIIQIPAASGWVRIYLEDVFFTCIFATYFLYAIYQVGVIWESQSKKMFFALIFPVVTIQLFVAFFICAVGFEEILSKMNLVNAFKVGPAFRSLIGYVGDFYFFVAWGASAFLTPWLSAYSLLKLENQNNFGRWLLAGFLFIVWPIGIWWIHPRLRKVFSTREERAPEDHYID